LSIRSIARFGGEIQAYSKIVFGKANNYIEETDSDSRLSFFVGGTRSMSMSNSGGVLHGVWQADVSISTSDRRLKKNIVPLEQTLKQNQEGREATKEGVSAPSATSWLLRQLRPVSYNFRKGSESKFMRFGFIADEMEKILPQIVRELPDQPEPQEGTEGEKTEARKGIVYGDLIAVLTSVVKDFNVQLQALKGRMVTAEDELRRLDEEDPMDDDFV